MVVHSFTQATFYGQRVMPQTETRPRQEAAVVWRSNNRSEVGGQSRVDAGSDPECQADQFQDLL